LDGLTSSINTLMSILLSLAGSVLTAFIAVRLSINRFRSTRWWERKTEMYAHTIGQLARLQFILRTYADAAERDDELSEDYEKQLGEIHRETAATIAQAAASGPFLISEESVAALDRVSAAMARPPKGIDRLGYVDYLDGQLIAIRECIKSLRDSAKVDLRLK